jgi:hypothetical protein
MGRSIVTLIGFVAVATLGCTVESDQTTTSAPTTDQATPSTPQRQSIVTVPTRLDLLPRPDNPPNVTEGIPHIQLDQTSTDEMINELADWAFSLDTVNERPSRASLPGARALVVAPDLPLNSEAVIVDREFAHIHPQPNGGGSLHLRLPQAAAQEAVEKGWGEYHPFALDGTIPDLIMVYAPRNQHDLTYVQAIIEVAVAFATSE